MSAAARCAIGLDITIGHGRAICCEMASAMVSGVAVS
jgi:hypothetical protein